MVANRLRRAHLPEYSPGNHGMASFLRFGFVMLRDGIACLVHRGFPFRKLSVKRDSNLSLPHKKTKLTIINRIIIKMQLCYLINIVSLLQILTSSGGCEAIL